MYQFQNLLFFIAGLSVFFYGQRLISAGIQSLGGTSIRDIVNDIDGKNFLVNYWNGARLSLLGFSSTMSNIVSIGLVNANLIKKERVIPMLFGSGLGATCILLILLFAGQASALNLIAAALILGLLSRHLFFRKVSKFLSGLGFLFLGISIMFESFKILLDSDLLQEVSLTLVEFSMFSHFLIGFAVGIILTILLRSQTLSLAISVIFILTGVFPTAFTFATVVASTLCSFVLNFWITRSLARPVAIRTALAPVIHYLSASLISFFVLVGVSSSIETSLNPITLIVLGHLFVNFLSILIYLVFKNIVSEMIKGLYPDSEYKDRPKLEFLGEGRLISSTMAYVLVELEITKLMDIVERMFKRCEDYIESPKKAARSLAKIKEYEKIIDNIQFEINTFISKVISSGAGEEESRNSIRYLKISSDLEQLADSLDKLTTMLTKYYEHWELSFEEKEIILRYFKDVNELYSECVEIYKGKHVSSQEIDEMKKFTRSLKKSLLREREDFASTHKNEDGRKHIYYSDMITSISRVRSHVRDIYIISANVD